MRMLCYFILLSSLLTASAQAQSGKPATLHSVPEAKIYMVPEAKVYVVPVAKLMRVDEGVFELEIGKTIDLTNRKILLSIAKYGRGECCRLMINGRQVSWRSGGRINLKKLSSTSDSVNDTSTCFLDIVDIATPKGLPGIATFRLHCI